VPHPPNRGAVSRIGRSGCRVTMCRMCTFDDPLTVRYIAAIRNAPFDWGKPSTGLSHRRDS